MKFILQIIIFLVIQSSFSQELVSFKGDTLMDITDTLNECTNAFGNPEAEEYCRCWITSIAEKVSYKSFKNEYYAALNFGVDKIEKTSNLAQSEYIISATNKCSKYLPKVVLESMSGPISSREVEVYAQYFLDQMKNEIGISEYNNLLKIVNVVDFSKCYITKLYTEFSLQELANLSQKAQERSIQIQDSCLIENLRN